MTRGLRGPRVQVHHVDGDAHVVGYHRWEAGGPRDDVIVVASFANAVLPEHRIGVPRAGRWRVRFNSDWAGYDPEFETMRSLDTDADAEPWDGMEQSILVGLGPYSCVILSQDD